MKNFSILTKIVVGVFIVCMLFIVLVLIFAGPDKKPQTIVAVASTAPISSVADSNWLKPEAEKDYKKTCQDIVFNEREKGIYYKEFLKSPNKFIGDRLHFQAKIIHIEEAGNKSFIQAYITRNMDSVVMEFYGTMKIYDGDIIWVWGEGDGTLEGKNRMGVDMSWPRILAKYIKKVRSED